MGIEQRSGSRTVSVPAVLAGFIAAADAVLYVAIIASQGNFGDEPGRVIFVALYLVATATIAFLGAFAREPAGRVRWLGPAAGALFALGILGAFSIGLPLVVAGVLCAVALARTSASDLPTRTKRLALGLALLASAVLVAGIALT